MSTFSSILDTAIAEGIPGIAAIASINGKVIYHDAKGIRGPGRIEGATIDTIWPIFSMTKVC